MCYSWETLKELLILIVFIFSAVSVVEITAKAMNEIPDWVRQILRVLKWTVIGVICIILVTAMAECIQQTNTFPLKSIQ